MPSCSASLMNTGHFLFVHFANLSDPSVKNAYLAAQFLCRLCLDSLTLLHAPLKFVEPHIMLVNICMFTVVVHTRQQTCQISFP